MRLTIATLAAGVAALLLPLTAAARPAEVMVINPNPINVAVTSLPAVQIDPSQNDVEVTNKVDVTPRPEPYSAYLEVSPSSGGNSCTKITTPSGRIVIRTRAIGLRGRRQPNRGRVSQPGSTQPHRSRIG